MHFCYEVHEGCCSNGYISLKLGFVFMYIDIYLIPSYIVISRDLGGEYFMKNKYNPPFCHTLQKSENNWNDEELYYILIFFRKDWYVIILVI